MSRSVISAFFTVLLAGAGASGQTIWHVDDDAAPGGDGQTWSTAYRYLQDALAVSVAGDEIHVAAGIYKPDQDEGGNVTPGDREATFQLVNGVAVKGGYRGCPGGDCSGNPDERDIDVYASVLGGDLAEDDAPVASADDLQNEPTRAENSFTVVTGSGTNETAALDGFTVTGGFGASEGGGMLNWRGSPTVTSCTFSGNFADNLGGGMHNYSGDPVLTNCTFSGNSGTLGGGGLYNYFSSPTLANCTFSGNWASSGGAMCNKYGDPTLTNCTFRQNSAADGGGMHNYRSSPKLMNCAFSANSAESLGGGMYNEFYSNPTLTNCTLSGNLAEYLGGGIYNHSYWDPTLTNCILWGNKDAHGYRRTAQLFGAAGGQTTVTYSCVQDAIPGDGDVYPGVGNIDAAPFFVDAEGPDGIPGTGDEDLGLGPRSPCIDAGDNTAVPADVDDLDGDADTGKPIPVDLKGLERFFDEVCSPNLGYADPAWPGLAIVDLGALEYQGDPPGDPDGDGLTGCYDNCPLHDNPEQADCDLDGVGDVCALTLGMSRDCQLDGEPGRGIPDACDIADGTSNDGDLNGVPDECQGVFHVDDDAPLGGDGTDWATAFTYLQDALAISNAGDEIRVAGGIYKPDRDEAGAVTSGDRYATFRLINGVALRGGYRGCPGGDCTNGNPNERDAGVYTSMLSGDLTGDDAEVASPVDLQNEPTRAENSYHVLNGSGTDQTAILSGFTIVAANANELYPSPHRLGGGMLNDTGSPTLQDCMFSENSATYGGGMYNWNGNPTLTNCTFSESSARIAGGGMRNEENSRPTLTDCTFSENSAGIAGGGMYNSDNSDPTLTSCTFSGNSAEESGGGMRNHQSDPTLTDCTFTGNSAPLGGGTYNEYGYPMLTNCTLSRNSADKGGGMYNDYSHPTLTDCVFSGNSAASGAGMYSYKGSSTLSNCTFSENSATAGGGVLNSDTNATLTNCTFSGNSAESVGSGMYNVYCDPILTNCRFSGNSAGLHAGGMCNSYSNSTLVNCTFVGNAAEESGGGMYNVQSDATLTNCTFLGNVAEISGGGMYNSDGSDTTLLNCILWGNRDLRGQGRTGQIADPAPVDVVVNYSCIQDAIPRDGYVFPGAGNIDLPPLFVDALGPDNMPGTGDEDPSLLPRSPCIDAGDNTAVPADADDLDGDRNRLEPVPVDQAGLGRFFDDPCTFDLGNPDPSWPALAIVDMGAMEYRGDPPGDPDGDGLAGCEDNCPLHANSDQADCDLDGLGDVCDLAFGASRDCQSEGEAGHGIPDHCDIADGTSGDVDANGVPDECQGVLYVDDNAPLGGDGHTWPTAFRYLQDAMANATVTDTIRVAGGTYRPDKDEAGDVTPGDREATFQLVYRVSVQGGYQGCPGGNCSGGDPNERDIQVFESVLSGDLAGDDTAVASSEDFSDEPSRAENSLHVVTGRGADETTVLDGFTVTGGNANGSYSGFAGGGMYNQLGSPTLVNCTFSRNSAMSGGGMYNTSSVPMLTDCTFLGNSAGTSGGGMFNIYSAPLLMNCTFSENTATEGGGMYNAWSGIPTLTDCTFAMNSAQFGGGMYNYDDSISSLVNCALVWNSADDGGGIYSHGSESTLANCTFSENSATNGRALACNSYQQLHPGDVGMTNCILANGGDEIWNNDGSTITVSYGCVQDEDAADGTVYPGEGNIDDDPLFVPGPEGCYYLSQTAAGQAEQSPCVDSGSDTAANLDLDTMTTRTDEAADAGLADMGYHYPVTGKPLVMGDYNRDGTLNLADFAALQRCFTGPGPTDVSPCCRMFEFGGIDGDVDGDDFARFQEAFTEIP